MEESQPAAPPSANLRWMRSRSRPRSSVFATTLSFQLTLPIPRSAGPQKEGALVCSKGTNLGPAQQSSAGLLHFERWQGNWIHREPQATENPVTRFPSGGNMHNDSIGKNRYSCDESRNLSREALIKSLSDFILGFLCNARNNSTQIASYLRQQSCIGLLSQDKLIGQPLKGKRFNGQAKRQSAAGLQVLCRTRTLLLHIKAPSFRGPAVAAKQTEVSCWLCRRLFPLSRPCGPGSVSSLQLTSAPWAAPSQGRSLVLSQFHILGVESLGLQSRRSRWSLASFLGKARCPAEDPRAGPTLASLLHNKTPSICGPAVAPSGDGG